MSEWTKEKIDRVMKSVRERAVEDRSFRTELLAHPHQAIKDATGEVVPDSIRLQMVDQSAAHITVVLPPMAEESDDELSEQQLEAVAGGKMSQVPSFKWRRTAKIGSPYHLTHLRMHEAICGSRRRSH